MLAALLSPRMLLLHVLAVVAVGGAGWLGLWQYGAWQENRQDRAAALADAEPRPLDDVIGPDDPFPGQDVGRPVRFTASWQPEQTVYVDGKAIDGREGYWVVTPAVVCGDEAARSCSGSAVLVVRGWSPTAQSEAPAAGPVEVTGWLQPGEGSSGPDPDPTDAVVPSLRVADLLQRSDRDLYGAFVIARSPQDPSLVSVTPDQLPEPDTFTSLRNLLYAVEWWVFGAFAVFLWWRWCRDEVDRVTSVSEDTAAGDSPVEPEVGSSA